MISSLKHTTENIEVPYDQRFKFVLNDDEILKLAKWACIIEDHYSAKAKKFKPMDVEWAKDGVSNELFIVQARPETVQSQKNFNILEEYVKPAGAADGGNIAFDSFDEETKIVKVILQGACSGCPSSTFTLKSGIENMLKSMLNDEKIQVEALNS